MVGWSLSFSGSFFDSLSFFLERNRWDWWQAMDMAHIDSSGPSLWKERFSLSERRTHQNRRSPLSSLFCFLLSVRWECRWAFMKPSRPNHIKLRTYFNDWDSFTSKAFVLLRVFVSQSAVRKKHVCVDSNRTLNTFHYLAAFEHSDLETEPIRGEWSCELHSAASPLNDTSHIKHSPQARVCISLSVKAFIYMTLLRVEVTDTSSSPALVLRFPPLWYVQWMQMSHVWLSNLYYHN